MTTPILRNLIASGLAGQLIARGVAGGFVLVMSNRGTEQQLASQRQPDEPRVFKRLDTLAGFLKDLGALTALIELGDWNGSNSTD